MCRVARFLTCASARWVAVCLVSGLAGCSSEGGEGAASSGTAPRPATTQTPQVIAGAIVWPRASEVDTEVLARLSETSRRVAARSPVPAFVVDEPALLAGSTLMARSSWYALSARGDGVIVSLHATSVAHRYEHIPALAKPTGKEVRGQVALVTQNEGIWSAAWNEKGVAYSLEVECAALPDARCESDAFVMSLAGRLAFVGGEGVVK